ncbi:fructokinase [Catalinimonas alkaloidigena]|uniref:carbohydrate kinase family protein n=1 Tax=Catalinimonas alkaloidigena TaxID=1075417 RepID=UPI002404E62D|nr:carbohydrate kinase [Catalinimonas alkaloidigena]MDF9800173.1 fructokinase [Catalinimonas alkaloidigena]
MKKYNHKKSVLCFGEMLFDIFPDGRLPGGAPMNVALHLQQHQIPTHFVSRLGEDEEGEALLRYLDERGLSTQWIQKDEKYPSGKVYADVSKSEDVSYEIVYPSAWDFIETTDALKDAAKSSEVFLYGSLAARGETSRATLLELLSLARTKVFDVNLRKPFYDAELIQLLLEQANIVKLNDEELSLLVQWYLGKEASEMHDDDIFHLAEKFSLETVCVTQGSKGASLLSDGILHFQKGYQVSVADTVGSGDAFLGAFLSQMLNNKSAQECLQYGCAAGAYVASQKGATPKVNTQIVRDYFK